MRHKRCSVCAGRPVTQLVDLNCGYQVGRTSPTSRSYRTRCLEVTSEYHFLVEVQPKTYYFREFCSRNRWHGRSGRVSWAKAILLSVEGERVTNGMELDEERQSSDRKEGSGVGGWRLGAMLAGSAALGGIAIALWNRRLLAQIRLPHPPAAEVDEQESPPY